MTGLVTVLAPMSATETMALLSNCVRERGDLPGFSKVIAAILSTMRGESEAEFNMTSTILADPALTQRVLRLANSPMYAVFGSQINTVSKAVMVLGTEAIGHLALGLKVIDGLSQVSGGTDGSCDEMEKAVLAGHVARQVASCADARDTEEVVVCSVLHSVGRMMLSFYLADQWREIVTLQLNTGCTEDEASIAVLGLSPAQVGRKVGTSWGLPASIVESMVESVPSNPLEPLDHTQWLASMASMSSACAKLLHPSGIEFAHQLDGLVQRYAAILGLDASSVLAAVYSAKEIAQQEQTHVPAMQELLDKNAGKAILQGKPVDALARLLAGVAEMRDLVGQHEGGRLMSMALETVSRGLGFSRTIAFVRNRTEAAYVARLGLGEGVDALLPRLSFSDAYQPDVFHAALANDKMIFIEDAKASAFTTKLPRWWREGIPTAHSFILLPLIANRQPFGFIYADWDESIPAFKIGANEIAPLNELRSLLVKNLQTK